MLLGREVLEAALAGLEARRVGLDRQIEQIYRELNRRNGKVAEPKKKRVMSAAARKRISLAQKKRWREAREARGE